MKESNRRGKGEIMENNKPHCSYNAITSKGCTEVENWVDDCLDAQQKHRLAEAEVDRLRAQVKRLEGEIVFARKVISNLVQRCDGPEGVRADGSNIQTIEAHYFLDGKEERHD